LHYLQLFLSLFLLLIALLRNTHGTLKSGKLN